MAFNGVKLNLGALLMRLSNTSHTSLKSFYLTRRTCSMCRNKNRTLLVKAIHRKSPNFVGHFKTYTTSSPTLTSTSNDQNDEQLTGSALTLSNRELNDFISKINSLVLDDPKYRALCNEILASNINRSTTDTHNSVIDVKPASIDSLQHQKKELRRKLIFRLGCLILTFNKLTIALEKNLINDLEKYQLLMSTMLNEMNFTADEMVVDSTSDYYKRTIDIDLSFVDEETFNVLLNGSFNDQYDEDDDDDNLDDDEEDEDDDDDEADDNESSMNRSNVNASNLVNESYLSQLDYRSTFLDNGNDQQQRRLDSLLGQHSRQLDLASIHERLDYGEDVLYSIEKDIENKASVLRDDFPLIDKYIHAIKLGILREWLQGYNDETLRHNVVVDRHHVDKDTTSSLDASHHDQQHSNDSNHFDSVNYFTKLDDK